MGLSDEEKATLAALQKKAEEPDPDEDFEIEIYDGPKGARVPYSKGRSWLRDTFGIDIGDAPNGNDDGHDGGETGKAAKLAGKEGAGKEGPEGTARRYFKK